jgi:hypothetical protein
MVVILWSAGDVAEARSGRDIVESCGFLVEERDVETLEDAMRGANCTGYVTALHDALVMAQQIFGQELYCFPRTTIQASELVAIFHRWLSRHREELDRPAQMLFAEAMIGLYPCKRA